MKSRHHVMRITYPIDIRTDSYIQQELCKQGTKSLNLRKDIQEKVSLMLDMRLTSVGRSPRYSPFSNL